MLAPQLRFYAADRAGGTAIVATDTRAIVAWITRDGDELRVRRGAWESEAVETVPQCVRLLAEAVDSGRLR